MTLETLDQTRPDNEKSMGRSPRLLLADDSVTIRKVVELTFADEGIDVSTVPDAQEAMSKFVEIQPDIVLVDAGLPGTSGFQICEMIKQDEATRHIPVLLLIGSFEPFDQDEADRVGADGVLTKPFNSIRDLVARVSELLPNGIGKDPGLGQLPMESSSEAAVVRTNDHPSGEDLLLDNTAGVVGEPSDDNNDIKKLYESSFADTVEIEEFETVEDMFPDQDQDQDDDLIEESHPAATDTAPASFDGGSITDEASTIKEFDWSPTAKLEEPTAEPEGVESPKAKFSFVDSEKEMEDDSLASVINDYAKDVGSIEVETLDLLGQAGSATPELSPEMIDRIAHRVAEIISDSTVREVAKEAVPRIAEKLIREALDTEKDQ